MSFTKENCEFVLTEAFTIMYPQLLKSSANYGANIVEVISKCNNKLDLGLAATELDYLVNIANDLIFRKSKVVKTNCKDPDSFPLSDFIAEAMLSEAITDKIKHRITIYSSVQKLGKKGGRNETMLVFSCSPRGKKYWVTKPFSSLPEFILYPFSICPMSNSILEVYFGHLAATILGKNNSPKTKFNIKDRAIVSRIIGDDLKKTKTLDEFITGNRKEHLTLDEQLLFLNAILYGIIIGDRDMLATNFIVQLSEDDINSSIASIYGIDHEFALRKFKDGKHLSLLGLLNYLHNDPTKLARIVCDSSLKWNNTRISASKNHAPQAFFGKSYQAVENMLTGSITIEHFNEALSNIVDAIAAEEYKICFAVLEKIQQKISMPGSIYTTHEVKSIVKSIGTAIKGLQLNVASAQQFLTAKQRATLKPH